MVSYVDSGTCSSWIYLYAYVYSYMPVVIKAVH